jgi:hypothetical protein
MSVLRDLDERRITVSEAATLMHLTRRLGGCDIEDVMYESVHAEIRKHVITFLGSEY